MFLPISLNLKNRPCLVVGGGAVAARKVSALLQCEARITIVALALAEAAVPFADRCTVHLRAFTAADCAGQLLVYACTDSATVNAAVAAAARAAGALCDRADASGEDEGGEPSDFHSMAAIHNGPITIAIATGGASPALAHHLKEIVGAAIGPEYGQLAALMSARRAALEKSVPAQADRAALWAQVLASPVLTLLRQPNPAAAELLIDEILFNSR